MAKYLAAAVFSLAAFAAQAEKRVALVIGNAAYLNSPTLPNPINDAEDLAAALERVGFAVRIERNLTKRDMESALARFARDAEDADAAMFFYAGHAIQYRGANYLMPIDARLDDEVSVNYELLRIDDVMYGLDRARGVKLLVLDACRNNPLLDRLIRRGSARDAGVTRGLARIDPARGMVVAYSTQADQVALDGAGRNSPFTGALVKNIDEPGLEIGSLFRRVAIEVDRTTGGKQLPELWVTLRGEFYLNTRETDLQAWGKIRASGNANELSDFVRRYPASDLAAEARRRLEAIERERLERDRDERLARERVERERRAQELARLEREQDERARSDRERAERERVDRQQLAEQAERERLARESAQRESAERERTAREFAEREMAERERLARQQAADQQAAKQQTAMLPPTSEPAAPQTPAASPAASSALVSDIKRELKRVGCYAGKVDENWATADTQASISKFARLAKLHVTPEQPSSDLLDAIRLNTARVCPLECGARQVARGGACVAKICPASQRLDASGQCVASAKPKPPRQTAKPRGSGGRCFNFGGNSFCE